MVPRLAADRVRDHTTKRAPDRGVEAGSGPQTYCIRDGRE